MELSKDLIDFIRAEAERAIEVHELKGKPWSRTKKWVAGGGVAVALSAIAGALAWMKAEIADAVDKRLEGQLQKITATSVALAQAAAQTAARAAVDAGIAKDNATAAEAQAKSAIIGAKNAEKEAQGAASRAASAAIGGAKEAEEEARGAASRAAKAASDARGEVESALTAAAARALAEDSPIARKIQAMVVPTPFLVELKTDQNQTASAVWLIETNSTELPLYSILNRRPENLSLSVMVGTVRDRLVVRPFRIREEDLAKKGIIVQFSHVPGNRGPLEIQLSFWQKGVDYSNQKATLLGWY